MKNVRKFAGVALALSLFATACGGSEGSVTSEGEGSISGSASGSASGSTTAEESEAASGSEASGEVDTSEWPEKLVFGFVPSREADKLVGSADALAEVLSTDLGIEAEAFVASDYSALTEAMASGRADIGAFGPLGVVRAIDNAGVEFVLQSQRFGSFTYHTQYMTNDPATYCSDDPVADEDGALYCNGTLEAEEGPVGADAIAQIGADTKLAYVDPTSTSGYLIPALQMMEQGVDLDAVDTTFSGGHDASVLAVYNGDVEVGLSFDDARSTVAEQFSDVGEKVVVFAYSEEIPNDGFVVRGDLPQSLKDAIVESLLAYADTEEGQTTLDELYEIGGLREADSAVLDVVRRADEQLGDGFEG